MEEYQKYDYRPKQIGEGKTTSLDSIISSGNFADDILDNLEKYLYDHSYGYNNEELYDLLRSVQGKPDAEITVYRGTPRPELNNGDWISLSKDYVARRFAGASAMDSRAEIFEFTVKASEISFNGKSLYENGYFGERREPNLTVRQKALSDFGFYGRKQRDSLGQENSIQASKAKINSLTLK